VKVSVSPFSVSGSIPAISSKSEAHRLLIAAALSGEESVLACHGTSNDIDATAACLCAMGADIVRIPGGFRVRGIREIPSGQVVLPVGESGSTYRFLAPVAAALGLDCEFALAGRLPSRPMTELFTALRQHGAEIAGEGTPRPRISGKLQPGVYEIPGDVSSQYLSGLLFALPLLSGDSTIRLTSPLASVGYVDMTLAALASFGVRILREGDSYPVSACRYLPRAEIRAEGDWSNAAFFLAAAAAGGSVTLTDLEANSLQGDRAILDILRTFGAKVEQSERSVSVSAAPLRGMEWNVSDVPDLVPAIAVAAVSAEGITRLTGASRLAMKESDRLRGVTDIVNALGGCAECSPDEIRIRGTGGISGGTVSSIGDHRMAMMACAMAVRSEGPVSVTGAEAVNKSYPGFYEDLALLGAQVKCEETT